MSTRQYIGARYVPKFYDFEGSTEWRSGVSYEPLTIVTRNGNSYTSKKPVPTNIGAPESNAEYWAATGIYNSQLEHYVDLVNQIASPGAIDTENLADSSVETAKIANESVTASKLADDSVTEDKIADKAVHLSNLNYDVTSQIYHQKPAKKEMFAHRGASDCCPENSLAAFTMAKVFCFDGVETDVQFTSDGVPICMHDDTVDRTTTGTGAVSSLTLAQIRAFTIDYSINPRGVEIFPNEVVPTYEEFLLCCKKYDLKAIPELKNITAEQAVQCARIAQNMGVLDNTLFISFELPLLEAIKDEFPNSLCAPLLDLTETNIAYCVSKGFYGIDSTYANVSSSLVALAHANGLKVFCWTVNDGATGTAMSLAGVDGQTSNGMVSFADQTGLMGQINYATYFMGMKPINPYEIKCLNTGRGLIRTGASPDGTIFTAAGSTSNNRVIIPKVYGVFDTDINYAYNKGPHGVFDQFTFLTVELDGRITRDIGWRVTTGSGNGTVTRLNSYFCVPYLGSGVACNYLDIEMLYANGLISIR